MSELQSIFSRWVVGIALYMAPRWPMGLQNGLHIAISVYYGRGIAGNIYCKYTSSTAQGGGGSFKNRKPIGEVGCCESGMAERSHCWSERWLISLTISLSFSDYLPTYPPTYLPTHLPTYLSTYVSIDLSIYLPIYLSIYLSNDLSIYLSISLSLICLSV